MATFDYSARITGPSTDLDAIALHLNGNRSLPTREEFYTNYPFYKYWNNSHNDRLLSGEGVNIYIHIPFCIQICDYCFYMKEIIKSREQVDEYVDSLCQEIQLVSETFGLQNRKVNSIYIGGGTPSVLTEKQFNKLIEALHRYHRIQDAEFAFEAEPGTFNRSKLEWWKAGGVNRLSMGVQSFDDEVIRLSSRKHTAAQAIQSIKIVKETGGFEINIDLLSGLAGESVSTWERSVATAIEQETDMLTVYKMKTYANTNFFRKGVHGNEIQLPSDVFEIDLMERAIQAILGAGYTLWSTFAFTRNDAQSKYIEYTWRGQDMVAYGASSFGKLGNLNYQNLNNVPQYVQKVKAGIIPVYRTFPMSYKDMIVKEILLCAVRLFSYSKKEFVDKFGFDYFQLVPEIIEELRCKGYITPDKEELVLTRQGVLFGDFVSKTLAAAVKEALAKDTIGFTY
ncbi:radical SAM family heme chaperone HemW [Puia dinghuensis]|uniref:Heme chaperone HemW n=1 Tax=Puia dinghuensis TaxID=1792502 RepID=A0A8J2UH26_9BACT|nr:radical SAM family heme chaperone HemW [Puia dinghuensis]GGB14598.1 coproporphyrinogen III oxidase [Puia dinghuensis]